jgi:hypothetical protein
MLVTVATILAVGEPSSPIAQGGPFKGVDAEDAGYRYSSQWLLHQRNQARLASAPAVNSADMGDVVVIADNGAIIIPPSSATVFDLPLPLTLSFTPRGQGFLVSEQPSSWDSVLGGPLLLDDDDTQEVPIPFSFPLLGGVYTRIWVNSDGNFTFGQGDSTFTTPRDAARLIGGPPRAAPMLQDLNPSAGGTVRASVRSDRLVVTWSDVPVYGTTALNTFQGTLFSDGRVTFSYARISFPYFVIGVAKGGNEGPLNEIDISSQLPRALAAGAIFEEFREGVPNAQVDTFALSKEFYRTHPDKYDMLVVFTDFVVHLLNEGTLAFHKHIKNETRGIGLDTFDLSSRAGSAGELESLLMMNRVGLYWPTAENLVNPPIQMFFLGLTPHLFGAPPGSDRLALRARLLGTTRGDLGLYGPFTIGLTSPMSALAHEVGHRWLSFTRFVHPTTGIGPDSLDLLKSNPGHWNFFLNSRVPASQFGGDPRFSSLGGNAILDLGPCTRPGESSFQNEPNELEDGYSELDQYLMGIRAANAVAPFWYVDEPRSPFNDVSMEFLRDFVSLEDINYCGKRVDLTVSNIQSYPGIGPRSPAIGDEVDHDADGNPQLDVKTMAFILLVKDRAALSDVSQVDNFRRVWQIYGNGPATAGRGRFDTVLNPRVH